MWDKPQFDPYDAIVKLDAVCELQRKQIEQLALSHNTQAKTIDNLLSSIQTLQQAHLQLSQLVTTYIEQNPGN